MFMEQEIHNLMTERLLPPYDFHPYPAAAERDDWNRLPAQTKKQAIKTAEEFLNFNWPLLLAADFMSFCRNGNRKVYENPYFLRRRALTALVIGECIEGTGRFLDDIINGIWIICEESYWGVSAHNGKLAFLETATAREPLPNIEEPFIDLFAGETGNLLAWTAYLLKTALNQEAPQVCWRISLELERRIKLPFLNHNDTNWMGYLSSNKVNNWNPWITSNVLNVFLLTEFDTFRRNTAIKKMFEILDIFLNTYGDDGGCDEGTSYWSRAGGSIHDFCDQLFRASGGSINLFKEPLIKEIGRFIYREHIAGPYFINFADGDAKAGCERALIYHYGLRIHDDKLMELGSSLPDYIPDELDGPPVSLHRWLCGHFDCQGFLERKKTAEPPFVRDVWLPDIQVAAAREQEGSSKGLYLALKGGHNDESHNHNDVGNFIVYLNGIPVLIDLGVGVYTQKTFSSKRYQILNMQSSYHNLPAVNEFQQCNGRIFSARDIKYQGDKNSMQVSMEISRAYHPDAGISSFERSFHFQRAVPSITLEDRFQFTQEDNSLCQFLMCSQKPTAAAQGLLSIPAAAKSSLEITYDPIYSVFIEELALKDCRLERAWGKQIYRVHFSAEKLPSQFNTRFIIHRK